MSQTPLTPTRQRYLKVYIECLKKSERRIRGAFSIGMQLNSHAPLSPKERAYRIHIRECGNARGIEGYARALLQLRLTRSKFAAELEGIPWR